jgi:hypothetical protein
LEAHADGELLYASGSPETLLDSDLSMLNWEPSEYAQAAPIDEIMNDPVLGPVVCALSTEDTEIPNLHGLLPLPLDNYNSDDFLLEYTSADDEADIPSSPSEFHVYEEWGSSDALRDQVRKSTLLQSWTTYFSWCFLCNLCIIPSFLVFLTF